MLDDDDFDENLNLKIAIMSFINAILCRGTCGEVFLLEYFRSEKK